MQMPYLKIIPRCLSGSRIFLFSPVPVGADLEKNYPWALFDPFQPFVEDFFETLFLSVRYVCKEGWF